MSVRLPDHYILRLGEPLDGTLLYSRSGGTVGVVCWERSTTVGTAWVWVLTTLSRRMGLFCVVPLAADSTSRCSGTGPEVMMVPASCTLLYTGSERFVLGLYTLAKKIDPFRDCSSLIFRDSDNESAR